MKIEGSGKSGSVKGAGRAGPKKSADGASFTDMLDETGSAASAAPTPGVTQISSIDALLSLQQADDAGSGASKGARQRAGDLLDRLDSIRMGLLAGGVPVSTLNTLANMVAQRRDKVMDPRLGEILDEIDLRVQVELAKLGR
jgi:hypothetical protein